jgi:hypothetical protein
LNDTGAEDFLQRFEGQLRQGIKNATASQVTVLGSSAEDLISGGVFEFGPGETIFEGEKHSVYVSAFFIRETPVCFTEWILVRKWAAAHDYEFLNEGNAPSERHPVINVSWYDAIKWCNAKSEMEGLAPCYFVAGNVYRKGEEQSVICDWSEKGYRLPTKAEWEKAAMGDSIHGIRFNNRPHGEPYREWCWDRVDPRYKQGMYDPKGPDTGRERVLRGGLTIFSCGNRYHDDSARDPIAIEDECGLRLAKYGFRLVRSSDRTPVLLALARRIQFNFTELMEATALIARLVWDALMDPLLSANKSNTISNPEKRRGRKTKNQEN